MQARTPNITGYSSLESEVKNLNTRKNLITPPGNRLRANFRIKRLIYENILKKINRIIIKIFGSRKQGKHKIKLKNTIR